MLNVFHFPLILEHIIYMGQYKLREHINFTHGSIIVASQLETINSFLTPTTS